MMITTNLPNISVVVSEDSGMIMSDWPTSLYSSGRGKRYNVNSQIEKNPTRSVFIISLFQ